MPVSYTHLIACLTNIVLDLLFVVVLGWGVAGVGIATVISQVVAATLILAALRKKGAVYELDLKQVRFTSRLLRDIVKIGLPAGVQSDMLSLIHI